MSTFAALVLSASLADACYVLPARQAAVFLARERRGGGGCAASASRLGRRLCACAPPPEDAAVNAAAADSARPALPSYDEKGRVLAVDGERLVLDDMGPVVVTKEGRLRYISNWDEMSEEERTQTAATVARRNRQRIAKLKADGVEIKGLRRTEVGPGGSADPS